MKDFKTSHLEWDTIIRGSALASLGFACVGMRAPFSFRATTLNEEIGEWQGKTYFC